MPASIRWERAYQLIEPRITAAGVHVHPFDPAFPLDVRFLLFDQRGDIRLNRHEYFELLYAHSGEAIYQVQDRSFRLAEGDLFVIGSTLMHRMSGYPRSTLKAAAVYFLPDLIRGNDATGDDLEYLMPFLVQDAGFPHVVRRGTGIPAQAFELARRTAAESPFESLRARLTAKTYLKMMLVLLVNHYAGYRGSEGVFLKKQRDLERLKPIFALIDESYAAPIGVEDAALRVNMSKSSFMRFFKQVTGQPFVVYLNHFRVAKAQALLATSDESMAEISQEVGFCDQSYFGLVFRRMAGETPREYRLRLRREQPPRSPGPAARAPAAPESTNGAS